MEREERTGDGTWSSTVEVIEDIYDPVVRTSLGEVKDTFEFKLQNFADRWSGQSFEGGNGFNIGDKISIYYKTNTSSLSSSDLLMTGLITDVPYDVDATKNFVRVQGNNFSEILLNALVFYSPPAEGLTLPEFLEAAINSLSLLHDSIKVEWHPDNPTLKTDDTAFHKVYDRWFYRSAIRLLNEYSSKVVTGDGNYYWYVDRDNKLVWGPKTDDVKHHFNSSTHEYKELKVKKDLNGVVNFVIAKGGLDPAGRAITKRRDDVVSRAKHGFKYKLITLSATADNDLRGQDFLYGTGFNKDNPISNNNYPSVTGWASTVEKPSSPEMVPGEKVVIGSWKEYVDAYRAEIEARLTREAQEFIDARRYGRLQVELEFVNGKKWYIGDVISVTLPEINANNKFLRIISAEYTQDSERYVLQEDEGSI